MITWCVNKAEQATKRASTEDIVERKDSKRLGKKSSFKKSRDERGTFYITIKLQFLNSYSGVNRNTVQIAISHQESVD